MCTFNDTLFILPPVQDAYLFQDTLHQRGHIKEQLNVNLTHIDNDFNRFVLISCNCSSRFTLHFAWVDKPHPGRTFNY